MSVRDALVQEIEQQPESVAQKLLDYLHALSPYPANSDTGGDKARGYFAGYWKRYYGVFEGERWDESAELPNEKREDW
jgi:hypothetical protein